MCDKIRNSFLRESQYTPFINKSEIKSSIMYMLSFLSYTMLSACLECHRMACPSIGKRYMANRESLCE